MPPSLLLPLNPASTRVVCHAQKAAGFAKIIMVKQRVTPAVLLINNLNATLLLNLFDGPLQTLMLRPHFSLSVRPSRPRHRPFRALPQVTSLATAALDARRRRLRRRLAAALAALGSGAHRPEKRGAGRADQAECRPSRFKRAQPTQLGRHRRRRRRLRGQCRRRWRWQPARRDCR